MLLDSLPSSLIDQVEHAIINFTVLRIRTNMVYFVMNPTSASLHDSFPQYLRSYEERATHELPYINSKFSWEGGCPQTPLVGMHAFRTLLSSCYHPVPPLDSITPYTLALLGST